MSVEKPFKYTEKGNVNTTVNGVRVLSPGMQLANRYGVTVIILDSYTVSIKGLSGKIYKKNLKSVITQHSNGYYYLLYSSKNMGLRRDTCLFPYDSKMDNFFAPPPKNRSDYTLVVFTFGIVTLLADVNPHQQITEKEIGERLPTHKELYR